MKGVGRLSPFFIITARPSFLQFHLMLIRRNTGIAWMREGSLPDPSKQSTLFSLQFCLGFLLFQE